MATTHKLYARLSSPLALLLLATALAAGVTLLAYFYLQKKEETMKQELSAKSRARNTPKVNVVVPKQDAGVNTVMNGSAFVSRPVEDDLVYPDTILARDFPSMEGLRLARPVLRGRPVRLSDLQQPEVNDVAAILPSGTRAMTIEIDNLNSIAQTLRPHHRVDVFLLSKAPRPAPSQGGAPPDDKALEQASLFMQDLVVLATGKEFQDVSHTPVEQSNKMARPGEVEGARDTGFDSITLLVKPQEAAKLMVGQKLGTFRVVLRGKNDRDVLAMRPLTGGQLMPSTQRGRDAGIEFIVGGRGQNIVSSLAIPPSQQSLSLQAAIGAAAGAPVAAPVPAPQPPAIRGPK